MKDDAGDCSVPDCAKPRRTASSPYCEMHYYRLRRNGKLEAGSWHRRGACTIEGCGSTERHDGLCIMHWTRRARHGDPLVVIAPENRRYPAGEAHYAWTGEQASYNAIHQRIRAERGDAAAHLCADCGGPARQWSYDRDDPAERYSPVGPYSAELSHYVPRCVPCHKRFDLDAGTIDKIPNEG